MIVIITTKKYNSKGEMICQEVIAESLEDEVCKDEDCQMYVPGGLHTRGTILCKYAC